MSRDNQYTGGSGGLWLIACGAAAIFLLASGGLGWLVWRRVPEHAALLAGLGAPVPLLTRVVFAASSWMVRLLPLFILVGVPMLALGVLVGALVAHQKRAMRLFAKIATGVVLAVSLAAVLACAIVVYALNTAVQQASP